jgi:tetratricopeptide (TPR) repeat protein
VVDGGAHVEAARADEALPVSASDGDVAARRLRVVAGMEAHGRGDWAGVLTALDPATLPGEDEARFALTRSFAVGKLHGEAAREPELRRALALDPSSVDVRRVWARWAMGQARWTEALDALAWLDAHAAAARDAAGIGFELAVKLGRTDEAARRLGEACRLSPDDAALALRAVRFFEGQGDDAAAHEAARRLVESDPDSEAGWRALAFAALGLGAHDDARRAWDRLEALAPSAWRPRLVLAVRLGDLDRAARALAGATGPAAFAARATLALWAGRDDEALAESAQAPDEAEVALVRGAVAVRQGRLPDALAHLDAARAALRRRPDPDGWITDDVVCAWTADAHHAAGDRPRARAWAQLALSAAETYNLPAHLLRLRVTLRPTDDPSHPLDDKAWRRLLRPVRGLLADPDAVDVGTTHAVSAALDEVLAGFGGNRSAWPTRVVDGALVAWPTPPWPRNRARAVQRRLRTRDPAAVRADFARLQDDFPDDPTPHTYAGETLLWLGHPDEAEAAFHQALARERTTTWAWIGLGASLLLRDRVDDALAVWDEGVRVLQFEGPTLFVYRGEAHLRRGDLGAAASDLDQALVAKPERLSAWLLRALVDVGFGDVSACAVLAARVKERLPGLALDHPHDDPVTAVRAWLVAMRGNRSSTSITWVGPTGALRFGAWGRGDRPAELFPSVGQRQARNRAALGARPGPQGRGGQGTT